MHLGPFGCLTKLAAKRAELVQKFVPRSRVGMFRNERTRSTPLDPRLMFWCVCTILVHFGPFGCLTKHGAKRAELVQNCVPQSQIGIFRGNAPDPPHMTLNSCFGAFRTIWVHLGLLGCLTKLGAKRAECAKVRATKSRRNFLQQMHPINPIGH